MEDKIIAHIKKKIEKDDSLLIIENMHMVKMTEKTRDLIQEHQDSLTSLSLAYCRLFSLANFPKLPKLRSLNLNDNKIKDSDLLYLADLKNLKYLSLAGNQLQNLESFDLLKSNSKMKMIDLLGNPCAQNPEYRKRLFELFPNLELVDYQDDKGCEVDSFHQSDDTESEEDEDEEVDDFIDRTDEVGVSNAKEDHMPSEESDAAESNQNEEEDIDQVSDDDDKPNGQEGATLNAGNEKINKSTNHQVVVANNNRKETQLEVEQIIGSESLDLSARKRSPKMDIDLTERESTKLKRD